MSPTKSLEVLSEMKMSTRAFNFTIDRLLGLPTKDRETTTSPDFNETLSDSDHNSSVSSAVSTLSQPLSSLSTSECDSSECLDLVASSACFQETGERNKTRRKKSRTAFTDHQLERLEKRYSSQRYLSGAERMDLAESLDLTGQQVKNWFQNRRMKEKRHRTTTHDGQTIHTGGAHEFYTHGHPNPMSRFAQQTFSSHVPPVSQYNAPLSGHWSSSHSFMPMLPISHS